MAEPFTPVEDLLKPTPSWWMEWGNALMAGIFVLFLLLAIIIQYPDTIEAPVRITSVNPPAAYAARAEGRISRLFVADGDTVDSGSLLACMADAAEYSHLLAAGQLCDSLADTLHQTPETLGRLAIAKYRLGNVQPAFANLQRAAKNLLTYRQLNYYAQMQQSLQKELQKQGNLNKVLANQLATIGKEYTLASRHYQRQTSLFAGEIVAKEALENAEQTKLKASAELDQARINLANNQIIAAKLEQQILDLQLQGSSEHEALIMVFNEALQRTIGQIDLWKQDYLFVADRSGRVSFSGNPASGRYFARGELVLTVSPPQSGEVMGIATLSMQGSGRVKPGNTAYIRLDNYPYLEFGELSGTVVSITHLPGQEAYQAIIGFPNPLISTYRKPIPFLREMKGSALLITRRQSLFTRILNPFWYLVSAR